MDNNEINDIIAIFMGFKKEVTKPSGHRIYTKQGTALYSWSLDYHSDWAWIMPVWIKFRNIKLDDEQYLWACNELRYMMSTIDHPRPLAHRLAELIQYVNKKQAKL